MFKKLRECGADLNKLAQKVADEKERLMLLPLPEMDCSLEIEEPVKRKTISKKRPAKRKTA
jgi:hypothetical protein